MKNITGKQIFFIGVALAAVVGVVIFMLKVKELKASNPSSPGTGNNETSTGSTPINSSFCQRQVGNSQTIVLRNGDCGEIVKTLQTLYNENYANRCNKTPLKVDGKYGDKTAEAVKFVVGGERTSFNVFFTRVSTNACK